MYKKWSLYLGSIKGIKIFIHWTFFILVGWIFLLHIRMGQGFNEGLAGVLFILVLFICVILHELGHALTARRFNVFTRDITLYPIGGIASLESMPSKPIQELQVALAGPMVNLIIAALILIYFKSTGRIIDIQDIQNDRITGNSFLYNLMYVNVLLAGFNLIPAFPMDGGRVLRSLLAMKMDSAKATSIAVRTGQFMAIVFVVLGFLYNFWLVIIGLFIFLGASAEAKAEEMKHMLEGVTAKNVMMTKFTVLQPDDTLEKAAEYLLRSLEKSFLVVKNGNIFGILNYKRIMEGINEAGMNQKIETYTQKNFYSFDIEEPISGKIPLLEQGSQSLFPVTEQNNVVGVINKENIYDWIQIKQFIKRT